MRFSGLFVSLKGSARSRVLLKVFPKPWRCSSLCDSSQPAELLHWAPENQTLMPDDSWEKRTFRLDFLTLVRGPCCPPSSEGFPKLGRLMWLSPLYVFCLAYNPPSQIQFTNKSEGPVAWTRRGGDGLHASCVHARRLSRRVARPHRCQVDRQGDRQGDRQQGELGGQGTRGGEK